MTTEQTEQKIVEKRSSTNLGIILLSNDPLFLAVYLIRLLQNDTFWSTQYIIPALMCCGVCSGIHCSDIMWILHG